MAAVQFLARSGSLLRHSSCKQTSVRHGVHITRGWKIQLPGPKGDPYNTDLGVYRGDPSALHFPPSKTGTLNFTNPEMPGKIGYWDTTYAAPWFLLITSITHYITYITQFAVGLAFFNSPLGQHAAIPFLLVAGPLFQAMGGAGPVVMHEYEGFQITPFAGYPAKDPNTQIPEYNNDALRQVAYRALFQLQAIGAAMVGVGVLWPAGWSVNAAWGALFGLAVAAYFCPRTVWYPRLPVGIVELEFPPLPIWPLVLFAIGASLQLSSLIHLFGVPLGTLITVLLASGGLLEAGIAEGTYDQRWHLLAVVMLNTGGWLQVAAVNDWWHLPVFQGVLGAVLLGAAVMVLAPGGALPDLIMRLTSDPPLKQPADEELASRAEIQRGLAKATSRVD